MNNVLILGTLFSPLIEPCSNQKFFIAAISWTVTQSSQWQWFHWRRRQN